MAGWRAALAVLAALALAAPLVYLWSQRAEERAAALAPAGDDVASLRAQLAAEREHSRQLAQEVATLRQRVETLAKPAPDAGGKAAAQSEGPAEKGDAEDEPSKWFDADGLERAGIDSDEVERLRDIFAKSEMDLIELRNRAIAEGWYRTPRYMTALRDMRQELRADVGDQTYDELLFATGRNNRVRVQDVLPGSPAAAAGIQPGDVLLSYGDQRIFKSRELVHATTQPEGGGTLGLDVLRNGQCVRVYVGPGALGLRLGDVRLVPNSGC